MASLRAAKGGDAMGKKITPLSKLIGEYVYLGGKRWKVEDLIEAAMPRIRDRRLREEIEAYRRGGPWPSREALDALHAAILEVAMLRRE
jgi:hypothetical protein